MQAYLQTSEYTTAACSLMSIINHFNPDFKLNRENEFSVWRYTVTLPVRASSIYALAAFSKRYGLSPRIVLGEKEYDYPDYRFKGYTKRDIEDAKFSSKLYYEEAKVAAIPIEAREFEFSEVKKLLNDGKILLLRINEGALRDSGSTSKYVVVYEFNEKNKDAEFKVVDPKQGLVSVKEEMLKEAFETLETKKKRDHRMIIF